MAVLKVFVSSTCYDLGMVRAELRGFISNFGHEPVMSEFNDVLFDPKDHTHESCIKEIANSDVIILIIGSRFGGKAIPQAVNQIDIEKIKSLSKNTKFLASTDNISITQVEILRAIEYNIPIFTFVDSKVLNDHLLYEKNKDKDFIDKIDFASIDKRKTAVYIFEFINFLRLRAKNNSIFEFSKISDIEDVIKKQWSALLQRLLFNQRKEITERNQGNLFLEGIKDIKSLILTTISTDNGKEIGKGVLRYRRLIEFFQFFGDVDVLHVLRQNVSWDDLLKQLGIKEVVVLDGDSFAIRRLTFLIKEDDTFYECRYHVSVIQKLSQEWNLFRKLTDNLKESIIGAVLESEQTTFPHVRYRNQNIREYIIELEGKRSTTTTTTTINPKTFEEVSLPDGPNYQNVSDSEESSDES
jgi:hypothetical protein